MSTFKPFGWRRVFEREGPLSVFKRVFPGPDNLEAAERALAAWAAEQVGSISPTASLWVASGREAPPNSGLTAVLTHVEGSVGTLTDETTVTVPAGTYIVEAEAELEAEGEPVLTQSLLELTLAGTNWKTSDSGSNRNHFHTISRTVILTEPGTINVGILTAGGAWNWAAELRIVKVA